MSDSKISPLWLLTIPGAVLAWKAFGPHPGTTHEFTLRTQAFDRAGSPGVIVRIPPSYSSFSPGLHVVVYFHGWSNCIRNLVGDTRTACHAGGPTRGYSSLIKQFDASGINAILVVPQLGYEVESGAAGRLGQTNGLRNMLSELMPKLGGTVNGINRLTIAAHSGGYVAAASAIARGGMSPTGCVLFDALYGNVDTFESFARADHTRLIDLYTTGGGTMANSVAMEAALRRDGVPSSKARFERVPVAHGDVPLRYFEAALREIA